MNNMYTSTQPFRSYNSINAKENYESKSNLYLLYILCFSPLIYLSLDLMGYKSVSTTLILIITLFVSFYAFSLLIIENKTTYFSSFLFLSIIIIFFGNLLITKDVNTSKIYIPYFLSIYFIINKKQIEIKTLLSVTNSFYLVYVILSFLVYFYIIVWPTREVLNIFHVDFFGITFRTFIGFYGSTADIDSISMLVLLLNIFFNKNKSKNYYIILSLFMVVGTLTVTPFASVFLVLVFMLFIKIFGKKVIPLITLSLFTLFLVISFIILKVTNPSILELVGLITNGRDAIWRDMLLLYSNFDMMFQKILGFGNTDLFLIKPFGEWGVLTTNPHNSFFRIFIEYGIVIFIIFYFFISNKLRKCKKFSFMFICLFILTVCISNSEIFGFKNPIFVLWLFILLKDMIPNEK